LHDRRAVTAGNCSGRTQLASFALLGLLTMLAVRMALDAGITTDEMVQRKYGDFVLAWYTSGFTDTRAFTFKDLYLYGGLFDLFAQALISTHIVPIEDYDLRHVLSSLVAVAGVFATWLTAQRVAGPRAALLAAATLALTPAWLGHGLFNPKDIPFATAVAFVVFISVRIVMRRAPISWGDALTASIALGCTLAIRVGGMFVLAYPVLAVGLRAATELAQRDRPVSSRPLRSALVSLTRGLCFLPLAWLLMLSAWPWAQLSPLRRPFEAAAIASHFSWHGQLRYEGKIIPETEIPARYLPTWFGLTLPDFYVLAALCALLAMITFWAKPRLTPRVAAVALLLCVTFGPLLGVVLLNPVIYNGHRHFLFLLPPLAALAGLAFKQLWSGGWPLWLRAPLSLLGVGLAAITAYDMAELHPYEYIYFNRLSGGLAKQAPRFETDYWGSSYREGFAWVVKHYDPGGTRRILVKSCSADKLLTYYRDTWNAKRFEIARTPQKAEVFLDLTKIECREVPGTELHRIERQGVPVLHVLHPDRK
jgi:hypothetical protein